MFDQTFICVSSFKFSFVFVNSFIKTMTSFTYVFFITIQAWNFVHLDSECDVSTVIFIIN